MDQLQKICWHHWKERQKISKIAKFESDTSYVSDDIAPQSCKNLQMFVWWWGGGMGGRGFKFVPSTIQKSVKFCNFEELYFR